MRMKIKNPTRNQKVIILTGPVINFGLENLESKLHKPLQLNRAFIFASFLS